MPVLTIGDKSVTVGDEFLKLSPEAQNSAVADIARSIGASAPAAEPVTTNKVVRAAATGVPIIGGALNQLDAATNAALAPVLNPLFDEKDQLKGATFAERRREALRQQNEADKSFEAAHPIIDTAAKVTGGVAGSIPAMMAAPAAFGLTGPLPQMVTRGALSNAGVGAADALVRGEDVAPAAAVGGVVGGAAPLVARGVGHLARGIKEWRNPTPPVAQSVERVAGVDVPLTAGQLAADPAKQAEEEIMRRGGRGTSAEVIARQADDEAQRAVVEASGNIGRSLDPTGAMARAAPQAAGEAVQSELAAQAAAREAAAQQQALRVAAEGETLARGLGGGAAPVSPLDAGERIGAAVAGRRDEKVAATRAAYKARDAVEGTFDESVPRTMAEEIRARAARGEPSERLWIDPTNESVANRALKVIDNTVGAGLFDNRAAPRVGLEASVPETPGGGAPGWHARAQKLADEMISQGVNPVRARTAAAAAEGGPMAPHDVAVPGGGSVRVVPKVVEADSLLTSADKGYDVSLQPRNRARAASDVQVNDIAGNLNPSRLGVSSEADRGAPIVGPDGMVESGNGRLLALRRAYSQEGPQAKAYRDWLASQGVDVSAYKAPVLVRERATEMTPAERRAFTLGANQSATLTLSAPERALADARSISSDSLSTIRNPNDLGAVENRDFVRQFVSRLPQTEQGAMTTASGDLSSEGLARVRNAVLAKAYGDTPILSRIAESTKDDVKSISSALTAAAPEWAALRAAVERGQVPAELDITKDLLDAVGRTAKIRARGTSLESAMAQRDAFGAQSPESERLMRMFYDADGRSAASGGQIAGGLRHYAQEALKVDAAPGLGLGLPAVSAKDILDVSVKRAGAPAAVAKEVADKAMAPAAEAIAAAAEKGPVVDLRTMDEARKQLVTMLGDAKSAAIRTGDRSDLRAMGRILHEFDNVISDALAAGKFSGDAALAKELQDAARKSHAEYRQTFSSRGPGDEVGRAVEKILGRYADSAAAPDEIAALAYGSKSEPGGGKAVRVALRLKQILGETSPEWGSYKQGLFAHLTQTGEGEAQRSPAQIADRIDKFLNGRGAGLAKVALSAQERGQLAAYAKNLRAAEPRGGPANEVEKAVARIAGTDGHLPASPVEVADMLYGRTGKGDKGLSVRLALRLKNDLTPESWTAVRQGMWEKLTNAGEGKIEFGPQALSQRLHEFLNESGKPLARVLFTKAEREEMAKLASVYNRMTPLKGTTNPSGTAPMLAKIAQKASNNILALIGLGAHGISGAIVGHAIQRGGEGLKDARAGKEAVRLFFGPQARRPVVVSRIPQLIAAPAVAASQRRAQ